MTAPVNRKRRERPVQGLYMRAAKKDKDIKVEVASLQDAMEMPLAETGLAVRVVNMLEEQSILLVQDLICKSSITLLCIANFGDKTLLEVAKIIDKLKVPVPDDWTERLGKKWADYQAKKAAS